MIYKWLQQIFILPASLVQICSDEVLYTLFEVYK